MSARNAKHLFLLLAAILFSFHVQAMGHVQPPTHIHASADPSDYHQDPCDSGCCKNFACCVQAVEVRGYELQERYSRGFRIVSHRAVAPLASSPPDPPPRSPIG